ncbi:MAG: methylated DNA-protein cysteine methyltransferase [Fimbriimonas sp.]
MAAKRKTAREKLHNDRQPELADLGGNMLKRYGPGKMLIPTPVQVDLLIRGIPAGEVRTAGSLRDELGSRAGAVTTCPLCFGIFWRLAAEASEEGRADGLKPAPYWRVVKEDGKLNEKLPGGIEGHAELLRSEGHTVERGRVIG